MVREYGEVYEIGIQQLDFNRAASTSAAEKEAVDRAAGVYGGSWPETQAAVWGWVWINRKMVIIKFLLWDWKLGQIRGKVFEKAFGKCPFVWKQGPDF